MSLHLIAEQPLNYLLASVDRSTGAVIPPDPDTAFAEVFVNGGPSPAVGSMNIADFVADVGNMITFTPETPFNHGDRVLLHAGATYSGIVDHKLATTIVISATKRKFRWE